MSDSAARPHRWSLQTRLIGTVLAIVSLILVAGAVAMSAVLGQVLQENLNTKIKEATGRVQILDPAFPSALRDAATILQMSPQQDKGFLLLVRPTNGPASAAYVDGDYAVRALTVSQVTSLLEHASPDAFTTGDDDPFTNVTIDGVGSYRVAPIGVGATPVGLVGLPLSEVDATVASIFTTVGVVTAIGLATLIAAIVFVIRRGLRPLRAVADTAERVARLPLAEGEVTITERVPDAEVDDRTEIGRVGLALNTLLEHVDATLDIRYRNEQRMRRFVADASHELRTPLASIRGYSELSLLALRQAQGPHRQAQGPHRQAQGPDGVTRETTEASLERIQAQSLRMTALVEDLLLLARLDEGQELVYGTVDLTQLAVEAVGDARPAGPEHRWVLDVGEEPVLLAGDEARLTQVVANLLANARTHTPAGTTVTVAIVREGADALLRVHDDGPGVDPSIADELFERFSRADRSRARHTGGTGLGLSIAHAIVEAHHGSLTVTSSPGDTTFEVRLPARPADPS